MTDLDHFEGMLNTRKVPFNKTVNHSTGETELEFRVHDELPGGEAIRGYTDFSCSVYFNTETGDLMTLGAWEL